MHDCRKDGMSHDGLSLGVVQKHEENEECAVVRHEERFL